MDKIPRHVAIIPDGNRRWAKAHALEIAKGHFAGGMKILAEIIDEAIFQKIEFLTLWVFSTENWRREQKEIDSLMDIFRRDFLPAMEKILAKGVRLLYLGNIDRFPKDIAESLKKAKEKSAGNCQLTVVLAANYGGRAEIAESVAEILQEKTSLDNGNIEEIKQAVESHLASKKMGIPDPDLIIRTGGEQRLSGYLLWQSEYAELYFTPSLMPDFGKEEFRQALREFSERQRRFGK